MDATTGKDLEAIENLHRRDVAAMKARAKSSDTRRVTECLGHPSKKPRLKSYQSGRSLQQVHNSFGQSLFSKNDIELTRRCDVFENFQFA